MISQAAENLGLSKKDLAAKLKVSVSSLYYQPVKPQKDWVLKTQIEQVLHKHPSYGYRRIALELSMNKKRVRRVMRLFGIKPYRRRGKRFKKIKVLGTVYPNLLQTLPFPTKPNLIWVSDFTRIGFHSKTVYLATIMDVHDRRVVGWSLLTTHAVQLPLLALMDAVEKHGRPKVLHSDQGSEYKSKIYTSFAVSLGVQPSMSHKGSPWENGFQEAFYSQFKIDLGDPNRYKTLGELAVAIYLQLYYYNHKRIHSSLKMPPAKYVERRQLTSHNVSVRL